jgi:hypothetical protein
VKNAAIAFLLLTLGATVWWFVFVGRPHLPSDTNATLDAFRPTSDVQIYVGGEKLLFLEDPNLQRLLAERYHLRVNPVKAGSVEMVRDLDPSGKDALWPSTDIAVDFFRMRGMKSLKTDIVFNSPIVIYTGWPIANALIREGLVQRRDGGDYVVDLARLLDLIAQRRAWKDLGLPFFGAVTIRCTDPTRSNSGNMFAGLVANLFNDSEVVDEQHVDAILPKLQAFFARLGMMERSSEDIFRKFIATGVNNSMVVGYENQLVEFLLANPNERETILRSVCVLYPQPTVWSSHPIIALTPNGSRLIDAMRDKDIQRLAWVRHGFRSGLPGVSQDPALLNIPFIPTTIDSVIPLPGARAMDRIVSALETPP